MCDQVIQRFDGWMAQHFGDGFVVYFGYPRAHEDNARRAVHTTGDRESMARLSQEFKKQHGVEFTVQVGIHTGIAVFSTLAVVTGAQPALGDTPHIAAQLASLAAPNTVVVSPHIAAHEGYFVCRALGAHISDNASESLVMYQVCQESAGPESPRRGTYDWTYAVCGEGARGRAVARALGPRARQGEGRLWC